MKKRLFSILTALTLCLSLLPAAALAASDPENYVFDISEGGIITIYGGNITATGSNGAAGIGGGSGASRHGTLSIMVPLSRPLLEILS